MVKVTEMSRGVKPGIYSMEGDQKRDLGKKNLAADLGDVEGGDSQQLLSLIVTGSLISSIYTIQGANNNFFPFGTRFGIERAQAPSSTPLNCLLPLHHHLQYKQSNLFHIL